GATTPAPIFRILEQFRGTLVLDEADFKDSSSWVEMVKLLNNGYRPGMPVLRADKENGKWYPRSYQVFGPKLIATRFPFKDEALESRCLTAEMMPLTRNEIPRVLPPSFHTEVADLRAKLLTFRLANLARLKGRTFGNELLEPDLQPRLQEILIPLKAMLNGDRSMAEALAGFVHRLQERLFTRRRESDAGRVLAAVIELHEEEQELSSKNIANRANEMDEEAAELSAEKVGRLTKRLGFAKDRVGKGRQRLIRWDGERVERLVSMYGLKHARPLSPEKLSQPSLLSALASKPADSSLVSEPYCPPAEAESPSGADSIEKGPSYCPPSPPYCPPSPEAGHTRGADSTDGADGSGGDKGREESEEMLFHALGTTVEQAMAIWAEEGKPVIHLGPGERCFDLERLLSQRDINERHLAVVREWLKKRQG
ncbi:MAG: hypothetical protein ACE5IA_04875, partial [Dehalococcoidia bacterium]